MFSGGVSGYFGYEYQFYVSALLLLQAHKDKPKEFLQLEVETTFGQDAEATFIRNDDNGDDSSLELFYQENSAPLQVQVQIKTKSAQYQWNLSDIRDLLLKKDESRGR